jgi:DNA-directed RNA polymerase specialized sigma24 family protein
MTEKVITSENFGMLLSWLDPDQESAAQKYKKIRDRLVRVFVCRGCYEADDLADETINRVTIKMPAIKDVYIGEPTRYFYGVADKVHLEWLRKQKKARPVELKDNGRSVEPEPESDAEYECLEECLQKLPGGLRELIVEYYQGEKRAKIEYHKTLAEKLGLTINALQTKTCRIRAGLRKCVVDCLASA